MNRRFLLGFEGKQSAADWLRPVFIVCLRSSVPVSPFLWLRHRFNLWILILHAAQRYIDFYPFSRVIAEPIDGLLRPV